jgi:hypothetical protein
MFEEVFRIIFDRRHIKDLRIWVLIVLALANAGSFYVYHTRFVKPRLDRQRDKIRAIIKAAKLQKKIEEDNDDH